MLKLALLHMQYRWFDNLICPALRHPRLLLLQYKLTN
jgi:uncharacterized protein YbaR (Trm112 family)